MVANSVIDVWGLLLGWNIYGEVWDLLNGTGLAYIPFLIAVISSLSDNYGDKAEKQVKGLEKSLLGMVLVLIFVVIPFHNMPTTLNGVSYVTTNTDCSIADTAGDASDTSNARVDEVATQTVGGAGFDAKQPILWALVGQYSSGITYTAIKAMGCQENYSDVLWEMEKTKITDTSIRDRLGDFYQNCYLPASQAVSDAGGATRSGLNITEDYDWIGSTKLLENQYKTIYMTNMQKYGYVPDPANHAPDAQEPPGTANPYCDQVWNGVSGQADGLRKDVLDHLQDEYLATSLMFSSYGYKMYDSTLTPSERNDLFLKLSLQMQGSNVVNVDEITGAGQVGVQNKTQGFMDDVKNFFSEAAALAVGGYAAYEGKAGIMQIMVLAKALQIAMPQLVALAQLVVIIAAPIVMVVGQYRFRPFFQLALTYFAFEFINAIVALGMLVEDSLAYIAGEEAIWNSINSGLVMAAVSILQIFLLPMIWFAIILAAGAAMVKGSQGAASPQQGGVSGGNMIGGGGKASTKIDRAVGDALGFGKK